MIGLKKDIMTIIFQDYELVGAGAYGCVYKGKHNGNTLAAKRRYITDSDNVPSGCVHLNEIDVMCSIKHPNILHAIDMQRTSPIPDNFRISHRDPLGKDRNTTYHADLVYLITEAASMDLSSFCIPDEPDSEGKTPKDYLRDYMWQILSALAHLHNHGYIHRDIKPANILYFPESKDSIRLCDFDMCLPKVDGMESIKAMTPQYTPPEILSQGADVIYTDVVDIWGAGHVMFHLMKGYSLINSFGLTGNDLDDYILAVEKHFFPNGDTIKMGTLQTEKVTNIIREDLSDMTLSLSLDDDELDDLLVHMLDCNPETRWSALQCLGHPFFQSRSIPDELLMQSKKMNNFVVEKHYMTEEMLSIFDAQIDKISIDKMYGFFLGLDIMMRVCVKPYKGNGITLATCCFNMGMKFYDKESAYFIRMKDKEAIKRTEYSIISTHLKGKIYRENIYNCIQMHPKVVYKYITANDLLGHHFDIILKAIKRKLEI